MIKRFLRIYNSISLLKKFILLPIIGSVVFIFFFLYILFGTNYIKQDISYNMKKLAPLYIALIKNEATLEKISHQLQHSISAHEIDWIEDSKQFQKEFHLSTQDFLDGKYQDQLRTLNQYFDAYYISAISISKQIIENDPATSKNSSLVLEKHNILKTYIDQLKQEIKQNIEQNISHVFIETNTIIYNTIMVFLVVLFLSAIVTFFVYRDFKGKIKNILSQSKKIANGDINLNQRLISNSSDELGVVIDSINLFIEKLELKTSELHHMNTQLDKRQSQIHSLLNSIDEGIIHFDSSLELKSENYSQRTFALLGERLVLYNKLDEVLYEEAEDRDLFNFTINYMKDTQSLDDVNQYFSLLKDKVQFGSTHLKLKFKALTHEKYMLLIEDITESQIIKDQLELEKNNHTMVIHILEDKKEFFKLVEDFTHYIKSINSFVFHSLNPVSILQRLHTYKGMFLQFYLDNVANAIHEIELELKEFSSNLNTDTIIELFDQYQLEEILKDDLKYINSILGHDLLDKSDADLKVNKALKIKFELQNLITKEDITKDNIEQIIKDMYFLDGVVLHHKIEGYYDNIQSFAKKQELLIDSATIQGDATLILPKRFDYMLNSLIHVYRNIVAHGIETPEERQKNKKSLGVNILTAYKVQDGSLYLSIKDDGRGIDTELLKETLLANEIVTPEEINLLDESQLIQYIFKDKISTKGDVDILSGQGVGLSSIHQEVQILKGNIEVINKPNESLEFIFTLPLG